MNSENMDNGSKDLISSLPDDLIGHILSFLSTKNAALTSVLSTRWRYLLAFVSILDFGNTNYDYPSMGDPKRQLLRQSFKVFVDRVIALQGNALLNKFSLTCKIGHDLSIVNGWILNVLERGVIDLDLVTVRERYYPLPPKVLMCKTLVRLRVTGTYGFTIDVGEVFLPKLKTLYLDDVAFKDESGAAFAKLISGCPLLEELVMITVMCYHWESFSVSNQTLKRLRIHCDPFRRNPKSVSFDTPNLVYLRFTDAAVAVKYPKANFDSLVEAMVGIRMTSDQLFDARDTVEAARFLMGISNVKILYLSSDTLEVLAFCCKAIPVFDNLIHLTIRTDKEAEWESLPNLLKNCPNLETLVFEGFDYKDTKQCGDKRFRFNDKNKCWDEDGDRCMCKPWGGTPIWLSSSPVKILKVMQFGEISNYRVGIDKHMDLIKYFLETMPYLEQVILYYNTPIYLDRDLNTVSTELQMLQKVASPKCEIQVISKKISFSFTVGSSSSNTPFRFEDYTLSSQRRLVVNFNLVFVLLICALLFQLTDMYFLA